MNQYTKYLLIMIMAFVPSVSFALKLTMVGLNEIKENTIVHMSTKEIEGQTQEGLGGINYFLAFVEKIHL